MRSRTVSQIRTALRHDARRRASIDPCRTQSTTTRIRHQNQRDVMQQRLFGDAVRIGRASVCVEGCSTVISTMNGLTVDSGLDLGWDAGVEDDDDGG